MGFPRQECWSRLPFPFPGDLPNPGMEPASSVSPALLADSLPLSHWKSPYLSLQLPKGGMVIIPILLLKELHLREEKETGQMSNDWKQQSPNYNPKPPKPKALPLSLRCDCHVPSRSLGRLK